MGTLAAQYPYPMWFIIIDEDSGKDTRVPRTEERHTHEGKDPHSGT